MKKTILYISAVAMVAAVSCNKAELDNSTDPQNSSESLVFTAYANEETKTTLNDDETVSWSAGDEISINGVQYITDEGGKVASFRKFDNEAADPEGPYYAVYPKTASLNEQFDVNLASHVTEDRAASIINAISVAYSETNTLKFKNVCSIMKFQVPEFAEDITEITVSSDDALSGTAKVSYNAGEPTWGESGVGDLKYSITLTLPDNAKFEKDTEYYVPIYPGTKKNLVFRINGYLAATVSSVDFERSEIRGIGTIPAPKSGIFVRGHFNNWDTSTEMYPYIDNLLVARNVNLNQGDFKFANESWSFSVGAVGEGDAKDDEINAYAGSWYDVKTGEKFSKNISLENASTHDIYFDKESNDFYITDSGNSLIKITLNSYTYYDVYAYGDSELFGGWAGKTRIHGADGCGIWYIGVAPENIGKKFRFIFSYVKDGRKQTDDMSSDVALSEFMSFSLSGTKITLN